MKRYESLQNKIENCMVGFESLETEWARNFRLQVRAGLEILKLSLTNEEANAEENN